MPNLLGLPPTTRKEPDEPKGLAEILEKRGAEIITLWLQRARVSSVARALTDTELIDTFDAYVRSLADALNQPTWRRVAWEQRNIVDTHLATRFRQGYRIDEVVHEYTLLAAVIASLELGTGARPQGDDLDRLFAAINRAITMSLDRYGKTLGEDDQPQQRFLALIEKVAGAALRNHNRLEDQLDGVVELVMEALDADSAAVFLIDPSKTHLDLVASRGLAGELSADTKVRLSSETFVTRVVRTGAMGGYAESQFGEVPIDPSFRPSIADALLGHPVCAGGELIGVIYVGVAGGQGFAPWQQRRISAIAVRLGLLLDNARLFRDREESIRLLEEERIARERFVSIVAHDLRGPVATVKLAAELLDRRVGDSGPARVLTVRISTQIDRMERMIHELLDANRLRAGLPLALTIAEVSVAQLVGELVVDLTAKHGDRFVVTGDVDVQVWWSAEQVSRALWNLLTNAVKYGTPDSKVTLHLRHMRERVLITVHNVGVTLGAEELEQMFRPFSRLHTQGQGWGLGLTLVRGCADAHGGTVVVDSAPARGTTFTFDLPTDARPHQRVLADELNRADAATRALARSPKD